MPCSSRKCKLPLKHWQRIWPTVQRPGVLAPDMAVKPPTADTEHVNATQSAKATGTVARTIMPDATGHQHQPDLGLHARHSHLVQAYMEIAAPQPAGCIWAAAQST
mmetsp:Transcript_86411/g.176356  ORF Transcript_86411/g.176356 Transcript_86411/m.176356 type:complete len:106 (+) Transcript_86411:202-519(+)